MEGTTHIAIAGNMGVGKSTLTRLLARHCGAEAYFESTDGHPYLERFYEDMPRWAFQSQFYFLSQAFNQHCEIACSGIPSIQDRTIYEHFNVFAWSLHEQGILDSDDFATLQAHYHDLLRLLPPPSLMIYLRASVPTLETRIRARGRDCEETVATDYLQHLADRYEQWMAEYDECEVVIIDTDEIDIHTARHREQLLDLLARRTGLAAPAFAGEVA